MVSTERVLHSVSRIRSRYSDADAKARLHAAQPRPLPHPAEWLDTDITPASILHRWEGLPGAARDVLLPETTLAAAETWRANIEGFIGTVQVPVGLTLPLQVNGLWASGAYRIPMATTEAALVASYSRGAALISACGGANAAVLAEGVTRTPCFAFDHVADAGTLAVWAIENRDRLREAAEATTAHGRLIEIVPTLEGANLHLGFVFSTGDASGQNMTTFATAAACQHIVDAAPVKPRRWFLDGNMSGDKKAATASLQGVRGRRVTAEATLSADVVHAVLGCTPAAMEAFWRICVLGGVMSGTIGVQGHFANGLAALYIATGQDAACVAESAVGITRMEVRDDGALYASVTLPNVMVGSVGGGTGLPGQHACLDILGLGGAGNAPALAEVAAALCLAGELSIVGAFATGDFSRAHKILARRRRRGGARKQAEA